MIKLMLTTEEAVRLIHLNTDQAYENRSVLGEMKNISDNYNRELKLEIKRCEEMATRISGLITPAEMDKVS